MEQFELNGIVWKDATTYSRADKEPKPTDWETTLGDVRVYLTCDHIRFKPKWVFSCQALGFDTKLLPTAQSREEAAEQTLNHCCQKVKTLYSLFCS